jgi:hypothetical protein
MKQQGTRKKISRHVSAFVAAGLFYLAGAIWIVSGLRSRTSMFVSIGAMFICIGSLWVVIRAKYKKEA